MLKEQTTSFLGQPREGSTQIIKEDDMNVSLRKIQFLLIIAAVFMCVTTAYAWETPQPAMDKFYNVVREAAPGTPGWTVYRPVDPEGEVLDRLPVVVWSDGACTISNDSYVFLLTEVAAHGFVIVAFGAPDEHTQPNGIADANRLPTAINWATERYHHDREYFEQFDTSKIATAGHSCGGVDAEYTALADRRVKTSVILDSGFYPNGQVGMSGPLANSRNLIPNLYGPIIFIDGGPTDVAQPNSVANYNLVTKVPAVLAEQATAGHGGFYGPPLSVELQAIQVVVSWLDGILNHNDESLDFLVGSNPGLAQDSGWTVQSKNF